MIQTRLAVNEPGDRYEQEAERAADAVSQSPFVGDGRFEQASLAAGLTPLVQRAPVKGDDEKKKKKEEAPTRLQKSTSSNGAAAVVPPSVESAIGTMTRSGDPLPGSERAYFESRFGHDFGGVRTHTGPEASGAAVSLGARAFTVGDHIFFGAGQYEPGMASGRRLLAHELTHTIQQQPEGVRLARRLPAPAVAPRGTVQRQPLAVTRATPRVQRGLFGDALNAALNWVAEHARKIPGYDLLSVLLARDPITDEPVERSAVNLVHAFLKLVPNGEEIFQELQRTRAIERTVRWFEEEVATLDLSWNTIKGLFRQAWDALSVTDLLHPSTAWEKIKRIFLPPANRLINFALAVGGRIVQFIKQVVLGKLSEWARRVPGYSLLKFILGKDPFSDEPVPRTARHFVRAVLDLVPGGDQIFENLERSRAIERTVEWLEREIVKLDLSWERIKGLFRRAWDTLSVRDLLHPLDLIEKIRDIFEAPARRVINFALAVGKKVLEFIFEGALMIAGPIGRQIVRIFQKIRDTFMQIVRDPIGFLGNLIRAAKQGFEQFGRNILDHLRTGVFEWLTGALEGAGLTLPERWDLQGILSLVLQILGITYANMRVKLVRLIGEPRVAMLERVFEFVRLIVTRGLAAAWDKIVEMIGSFTDLVIGGIRQWAVTRIVTAAITKLATMFNPVGALIQAIIGIYNTVAFFVERIRQILALVEAIVDSIANIVAGRIADAANWVERAMARTIPVILGFLARLIGLGDVSGAIRRVIDGIRARVDSAIDRVIDWVVERARALFGRGDTAPAPAATEADARWNAAAAGVHQEATRIQERGWSPADVEVALPTWRQRYGFKSLRVQLSGDDVQILGEMSAERPVDALHRRKPVTRFTPVVIDHSQGISRVKHVRAVPLVEVAYAAPQGSPGPWERIRKRGAPDWVRGHLVNGRFGGPGSIENLVPITHQVNMNMLSGHENQMRGDLRLGKYFWFDAKAQYRTDSESTSIRRASHFAREVVVEYGEAKQKGDAWEEVRAGSISKPYPVPLPTPDQTSFTLNLARRDSAQCPPNPPSARSS